jgi:hypothetical protein
MLSNKLAKQRQGQEMAEMILDYVFKYANEIEEGKKMAEMNLDDISKYASEKRTRPRNGQNYFFLESLSTT